MQFSSLAVFGAQHVPRHRKGLSCWRVALQHVLPFQHVHPGAFAFVCAPASARFLARNYSAASARDKSRRLLTRGTRVKSCSGNDTATSASTTAICLVSRAAPDPRSPAEETHRRRLDEVLSSAWHGLEGFGPGLEHSSASLGNSSDVLGPNPSTYGEVTPAGARHLARAMGLDTLRSDIIVFMDLGSGVGKLVAQAYLEWPAVQRAIGVELCESRSSHACQAWSSIMAIHDGHMLRQAALALLNDSEHAKSQEFRGIGRVSSSSSSSSIPTEIGGISSVAQVRLLQGDLLSANVGEATHVYLSSLCFDDHMMEQIVQKLKTEASCLQSIASLRALPGSRVAGFRYKGSVDVEMSWTGAPGTRVRIYERHALNM